MHLLSESARTVQDRMMKSGKFRGVFLLQRYDYNTQLAMGIKMGNGNSMKRKAIKLNADHFKFVKSTRVNWHLPSETMTWILTPAAKVRLARSTLIWAMRNFNPKPCQAYLKLKVRTA